jgi:hypothetical protein
MPFRAMLISLSLDVIPLSPRIANTDRQMGIEHHGFENALLHQSVSQNRVRAPYLSRSMVFTDIHPHLRHVWLTLPTSFN